MASPYRESDQCALENADLARKRSTRRPTLGKRCSCRKTNGIEKRKKKKYGGQFEEGGALKVANSFRLKLPRACDTHGDQFGKSNWANRPVYPWIVPLPSSLTARSSSSKKSTNRAVEFGLKFGLKSLRSAGCTLLGAPSRTRGIGSDDQSEKENTGGGVPPCAFPPCKRTFSISLKIRAERRTKSRNLSPDYT